MAELPAIVDTQAVCGRPEVALELERVDKLIRMGFTKTRISDIMRISRRPCMIRSWLFSNKGLQVVSTKRCANDG